MVPAPNIDVSRRAHPSAIQSPARSVGRGAVLGVDLREDAQPWSGSFVKKPSSSSTRARCSFRASIVSVEAQPIWVEIVAASVQIVMSAVAGRKRGFMRMMCASARLGGVLGEIAQSRCVGRAKGSIGDEWETPFWFPDGPVFLVLVYDEGDEDPRVLSPPLSRSPWRIEV